MEQTIETDADDAEFQQLYDYLDGMPEKVKDNVAASMQAIAELMKGTAVMRCPVALEEGGRLRGSLESFVEAEPEKITGGVGTSVEYGGFVEFGTGLRGQQNPGRYKEPEGIVRNQSWPGMAAQPYLRPALYDNEVIIRESIATGVIQGVQK